METEIRLPDVQLIALIAAILSQGGMIDKEIAFNIELAKDYVVAAKFAFMPRKEE